MQKVLFILAKEGFRDEEFFVPAEILKEAGHQVFVASSASSKEIAHGADGGEVEIDFNIEDVKAEDFDLIVFVGGPGALKYLDKEISYQIAKEAVKFDKKLAAICIAPIILAKAGVLKNRKATAWTDSLNKKSIQILEENGAEYIDQPVVEDGIVTANGPQAAEEFGKTLEKLLE